MVVRLPVSLHRNAGVLPPKCGCPASSYRALAESRNIQHAVGVALSGWQLLTARLLTKHMRMPPLCPAIPLRKIAAGSTGCRQQVAAVDLGRAATHACVQVVVAPHDAIGCTIANAFCRKLCSVLPFLQNGPHHTLCNSHCVTLTASCQMHARAARRAVQKNLARSMLLRAPAPESVLHAAITGVRTVSTQTYKSHLCCHY